MRLLEELNEGLVCLSGCARDGLGVRDPNAAAALARAFGPERFYVELQRPFERGDARRNAALVAVSTGLLNGMSQREAEAVLGHEIAGCERATSRH